MQANLLMQLDHEELIDVAMLCNTARDNVGFQSTLLKTPALVRPFSRGEAATAYLKTLNSQLATAAETMTMAERWVKAYREWLDDHGGGDFFPPEGVDYLAAWQTKVGNSSLSYSIMDFGDGSMAILRDHCQDNHIWMTTK